MNFKLTSLPLAVIFLTLALPVQSYSLENIPKVSQRIKREKLQQLDFRYKHITQMAYNNDIPDYHIVEVVGPAAPGSGVIIARNGKDYFLITAKHVVAQVGRGDEIDIITLDGVMHKAAILKVSSKLDAAIIKFSSAKDYYPAFISEKEFPKQGKGISVHGIALKNEHVTIKSLRSSIGGVTAIIPGNRDGYEILYNAVTNVGMSGGGLFTYPNITEGNVEGWKYNNMGKLIHPTCEYFQTPVLVGIHGRSEGYIAGGKSGINMGISIHSIMQDLSPALIAEGIKTLPKETETQIWKDGCPLHMQVKN